MKIERFPKGRVLRLALPTLYFGVHWGLVRPWFYIIAKQGIISLNSPILSFSVLWKPIYAITWR